MAGAARWVWRDVDGEADGRREAEPRAESRWPRGVAVDHDSEGGSRTARVDRLPVTRGDAVVAQKRA